MFRRVLFRSAVDKAYEQHGALPGKRSYKNDAERVAYLFELYQRLTSLLPTDAVPKQRKAKKLLSK